MGNVCQCLDFNESIITGGEVNLGVDNSKTRNHQLGSYKNSKVFNSNNQDYINEEEYGSLLQNENIFHNNLNKGYNKSKNNYNRKLLIDQQSNENFQIQTNDDLNYVNNNHNHNLNPNNINYENYMNNYNRSLEFTNVSLINECKYIINNFLYIIKI